MWVQDSQDGQCLTIAGLDLPELSFPATLEVTANVTNSTDAITGWGVWMGDPVNPAQRWEILSPGYFRYDGQTHGFHHLMDRNTLRLDLTAESFQFWLNRERAAQGSVASISSRWGLLGSADEHVCWQRIAVYGTH